MEPHETIWKFELPLKGITAVTYEEVVAVMPRGARVLHVAEQGAADIAGLAIGGRLCLWALVDPRAEKCERRFFIRGTGWELRNREPWRYLGTAICAGGFHVWHVFEPEDAE